MVLPRLFRSHGPPGAFCIHGHPDAFYTHGHPGAFCIHDPPGAFRIHGHTGAVRIHSSQYPSVSKSMQYLIDYNKNHTNPNRKHMVDSVILSEMSEIL